MKLINSTTWPDHFLRRLTGWCCAQLEFGIRDLKSARFANSCRAWGGRAYLRQGRIGVRIGSAGSFPRATMALRNCPSVMLADREEALVKVTAHEVAHLLQYREGSKTRAGRGTGGSESCTQKFAYGVLEAFRTQREALLAAWSEPPVCADQAPTLSAVQKRAGKAQADLARWTRKLKLAQTKVRKLKARVVYYAKS